MATYPVKDKPKETSERHQAILSELLKDDDNKYCVDCDAKGPRWASWNLGVFLCIRCAGIHRNLGVHISRVKSVNLDSWTAEQIATMEDMGNSKARAIYEANLPDGYKRPQTDSALEQFIRAKYELKKWIAKEWNPQQQSRPQSRTSDSSGSASESKRRETKPVAAAATVSATPPATIAAVAAAGTSMKTSSSGSNLTMSAAAPGRSQQAAATASAAAVSPQPVPKAPANVDLLGGIDIGTQNHSAAGGSSTASSVDLLADIFGGPTQPVVGSGPAPGGSSAASTRDDLFMAAEDKSKSQKDSIMALYSTGPTGMAVQPPAYGPGTYIAPVPSMGVAAGYSLPGSYTAMQHPGAMAAPSVLAQPGMAMMMGVQPVAATGAVVYPGMMVAPVVPAPMMVNGIAPGYYTQQQHAYLASQQLQQQMAGLGLGAQGVVAPQQQQQQHLTNGGSKWADGDRSSGGSAAAGKTLDFSLWH